jgi:LmbE family N-acetylglucosaminyl deacetylase
MRVPPLRARRLLVVAPHPDDEVVAAWALMRQLRRRGAQVTVLVVSDGGASHPQSRSWPRARLVAERRRETRRALRELGVTPDRIRFLNLPDGGLAHRPDRLAAALGGALRRRAPPDLIVAPMADDAHADHRAIAVALAALPRRGEHRLGYRVWPEGAARSLHGLAVPLGPAIDAKRRSVRSYRTQTGRIADAVAGFAMTHRHLRAFAAPFERFAVLR